MSEQKDLIQRTFNALVGAAKVDLLGVVEVTDKDGKPVWLGGIEIPGHSSDCAFIPLFRLHPPGEVDFAVEYNPPEGVRREQIADVKDELLANLDTHQTVCEAANALSDTLSDKIAEAMADALKNGGNTLGEAMAKANETGIGVVVVDSEGRAVKQTNA